MVVWELFQTEQAKKALSEASTSQQRPGEKFQIKEQ